MDLALRSVECFQRTRALPHLLAAARKTSFWTSDAAVTHSHNYQYPPDGFYEATCLRCGTRKVLVNDECQPPYVEFWNGVEWVFKEPACRAVESKEKK